MDIPVTAGQFATQIGIQLDTEENPKTVGEFADTVEAALEK